MGVMKQRKLKHIRSFVSSLNDATGWRFVVMCPLFAVLVSGALWKILLADSTPEVGAG